MHSGVLGRSEKRDICNRISKRREQRTQNKVQLLYLNSIHVKYFKYLYLKNLIMNDTSDCNSAIMNDKLNKTIKIMVILKIKQSK